ncbi:MAG: HEAT repeat domain-containing protein [Elusimicrobia bacterium]|nr:HEAT repeat domain-containing protein [Elusimicrobiota bacterium]
MTKQWLSDQHFGCSFFLNQTRKFARPGSKPSYAPDQDFDAQHIFLDISLDIPKKTLRGQCSITLKALNHGLKQIKFDAVRMKIFSVLNVRGQKLKFSYKEDKLTVTLPKLMNENETITLTLEYQVTNPIAGVHFIGPDKFYPKKPVQVWTHGEAEESRYWFPCFDAPHDKATTEMRVTVPKDFFALSNGALISVTEKKDSKTKTFHWKQAIPHSPYLVTLVAGKFSEIKTEWEGIPILYYCEPGKEEDSKRAFGKTPKMIQFFSEKIGLKYPYEKYAQIAVADFVMGGMEHTTATTQTDRVLMDERAFPEFTADWLVAHELAHQWFGDLLTCKEWSHAWLNESFATYFEALFVEHDLGKDEFDYEMRDKLKIYLEEDQKAYRRSIVTNVYLKPDDLFDRHLYEKGSLVLHMLRAELGDKLFWKAIHCYVETFQGKAVETNDLINAIQESTGKNMRKFFDQWVYGSGHPEYTAHYWWEEEKKTAHLNVSQKGNDKDRLFSIPIEFEFITSKGNKKIKKTFEDKSCSLTYSFDKEPLDFRFDPENKILKTLNLLKPYAMWLYQLQNDPNVVGRIEAAKEVAKVKRADALKILMQTFKKEKFWGTAKEIAHLIGTTGLNEAKIFLIQSLKTENPKVRRGVVEALGNFPEPDTIKKLEETFEKDKSYFVISEAVRAIAKIRSLKVQKTVQKALSKESWNDVIRSSAIYSLSEKPTNESLEQIKKYSQYGYSLSSRISAVQALNKCAKEFPEIFSELISLTSDPNIRVKYAAISALGNLKNPRAIPVLEKIYKDKNLPYRTISIAQEALLKIDPNIIKT